MEMKTFWILVSVSVCVSVNTFSDPCLCVASKANELTTLTAWTSWTECSPRCWYGHRNRTRVCTRQETGSSGTVNTSTDTCKVYETCLSQCQDQSKQESYGSWGPWSQCSSTNACGRSSKTRSWICTGGGTCDSNRRETKWCYSNPCPVDGQWTTWSEWTECTASCGGGKHSRSHRCANPLPLFGGKPCEGDLNEEEQCNTLPCPGDFSWSEWTTWSQCDVTCGAGNRARSRTCRSKTSGRELSICDGQPIQSTPCSAPACPVNGAWSAWSRWQSCSTTCGGGTRTRSRSCTNPATANGGNPCQGTLEETTMCSNNACPINGEWGSWSNWNSCSSTCGDGLQTRSRLCNSPGPSNGGKSCTGMDSQSQKCNTKECRVNGQWSLWTMWSECSHTCGNGTMVRSRLCTNPPPAHGGQQCVGSPKETQVCSFKICPVDREWTDWSSWTPCSRTCGIGSQSRARTCTSYNDADCYGPRQDTRICKMPSCPGEGNSAVSPTSSIVSVSHNTVSRVSTSAITTSQMNTKTDTQKTTATTAKATNSIQIDTTNEVQQTTTKTKILQTDTALDTSQTTDSVHLTTERGKSYTNYRQRQITQAEDNTIVVAVGISSASALIIIAGTVLIILSAKRYSVLNADLGAIYDRYDSISFEDDSVKK